MAENTETHESNPTTFQAPSVPAEQSLKSHPDREIHTFAIPQYIALRMQKEGLVTVDNVRQLRGFLELSRVTHISAKDALDVWRLLFPDAPSTQGLIEGFTAFELLQIESAQPRIITFSNAIDTLIGGGVPLGKLSEFCGLPGIGKTQICMQLAVDAFIPRKLGGTSGQCIYIDTEGSFVLSRVVEMAQALISHLATIALSEEDQEAVSAVSLDKILGGIFYYRIHSYVEQIALINLLPSLLDSYPDVRLVIVDSVTAHFRRDFKDMGLRSRLLNSMAQNLIALANAKKVAVVLTNQMTTKFGRPGTDEAHTHLVPALGESWGHACHTRIQLGWSGGRRFAHLLKSPSRAPRSVAFQVTPDGVRDV